MTSRGPPRDPRRPARAARHRSSVLGPPPGLDPGTGYISPASSPRQFQFAPPTPDSSSGSQKGSEENEIPPAMPTRSHPLAPREIASRLRESSRPLTAGSDGTPIMFYPSSTTLSSMDSDPVIEPMPFFRNDPRLRRESRTVTSTAVSPSLPFTDEPTSSRAVSSIASSGVLGPGLTEAEPDTEFESDSDESTSTSESIENLIRNVSLVRRGQPRIIRTNSGARRSVVPDVESTPPMPPVPPPPSPSRSTPPPIPPPQPPPRSVRRSRMGSPPPVQLRSLSPLPPPIRPTSSLYSQSPNRNSPVLNSPRYPAGPPSSPRYPPRRIGSPSLFPRAKSPVSSIESNSSSGGSNKSGPTAVLPRTESPAVPSAATSSSGRLRPRPPPLDMLAIAEGQSRGSLTSLPDLLDRATRLHDVLSTGRTASMLVGDRSTIGRDTPVRGDTSSQSGSIGDIISTFPPNAGNPRGQGTQQGTPRGSWPLANFSFGRPKQQTVPIGQSPLRQTVLAPPIRGPGSRRDLETPSPTVGDRGAFGFLFPKFDPQDPTPTGPLVKESKGKDPKEKKKKRSRWKAILLILLVFVILGGIAAGVTILLLKKRAETPTSVAQCPTVLPCQNNGTSGFGGNPANCFCICPSGFTGAQCETVASSCVSVTSDTPGGPLNVSIGSAIAPLISTSNSEFSSQFILSAQDIEQKFAADNVTCVSQNSLINLDGSTDATVDNSTLPVALDDKQVIAVAVWTTTTIITTITETFTVTTPSVTTSSTTTWTVFNTSTALTTLITQVPSSTYSLSSTTITRNSTATPTSAPSSNTGGISSNSLVFGRCVILAVVQAFGVSQAAEVQQSLEAAIEHGITLVQDVATGLTINLGEFTVIGLPASG